MKRILIDCDPGHDDMMAILLACSSEELEVLGVTTVAGNQTGEKTFRNARRTLALINRLDIPVARGADRPLLRPLHTAPEIHGASGLDGAELPEPREPPSDVHAVDLIARTLRESAQKVTLVPTGPLTNIALTLLKEPALKERIERIVLMGGAARDSNVTPAAEFNIYVDPEAAQIVFQSGLPITMVGLDVTNRALLSLEDIAGLERMGGRVSGAVGPLLRFFARANRKSFRIQGAPLHDALAVATLIRPEVVRTRRLRVDIETQGLLTRGQTVVDLYGVTGEPPNAEVALEVDAAAFRDLMLEAIGTLDRMLEPPGGRRAGP
jgi:inosine-uridine nucleoside N-ribohydrolase